MSQGDRGHLSHVIVAEFRAPAVGSQGLVDTSRIDDQLADERPVLGDDADVPTGDEEGHHLVLVGGGPQRCGAAG